MNQGHFRSKIWQWVKFTTIKSQMTPSEIQRSKDIMTTAVGTVDGLNNTN